MIIGLSLETVSAALFLFFHCCINDLAYFLAHTFSRFGFLRRGRKLNKKPSNLADVNKVRSFFPETWLWTDINTEYELIEVLSKQNCMSSFG